MTQFGPGAQLAAQCPRPPAPDGYRLWNTDADGPVPDDLAKRAVAMALDASVPMGTVASYPLPGVVALVRIETHVWGPDGAGKVVTGCFRVAGVYLPSDTPEIVRPPIVVHGDEWAKAVAILTAISLTFGLVAKLPSWAPKKR